MRRLDHPRHVPQLDLFRPAYAENSIQHRRREQTG